MAGLLGRFYACSCLDVYDDKGKKKNVSKNNEKRKKQHNTQMKHGAEEEAHGMHT